MTRYAILLGSAPENYRQKKIEEMFNFFDSKRNAGDSIVTFANGISELMLEMVLDNSVKQLRHCDAEQSEAISETDGENCFVADASRNDTDSRTNSILLYICTLCPVGDDEKSVWLCGEEIRKEVILHYQELSMECGIDMQIVFDCDSEFLNEEELGYEKVGGER